MRTMLQVQNEKIESMSKEIQLLREKVSFLTADKIRTGDYFQKTLAPRNSSEQNGHVPYRLQFENSCSIEKYSTHKIEADDKEYLKVAIRNNNNEIITYEPYSSMRVQIVAIHGDFDDDHKGQWTGDYFRSKIVTGRPGRGNLLSGNLYIKLQNGVGFLKGAKFLDNSSFVPSKRFKLGVMAAEETISERIQEGITESFAVKDVRGFSTKKIDYPSPHDAVYKLNQIAKNGDRHRSLEKNGIKTVGDLLHLFNRSPEDLRKIMGKISDQHWDTIISHARKCIQRAGMYSSCIQERSLSCESSKHESFSRSNASPLQGSCSEQQCPTTQRQGDGQVAPLPISSGCNVLSSGPPLKNVPREIEGIQVADHQVSSVRNETPVVSSMGNNTLERSTSQQRCSLEHNTTAAGNGVLPGNPSADGSNDVLSMLEADLFNDKLWGVFDSSEAFLYGSDSVVEHSGGRSSVNEARVGYGGVSSISEAL